MTIFIFCNVQVISYSAENILLNILLKGNIHMFITLGILASLTEVRGWFLMAVIILRDREAIGEGENVSEQEASYLKLAT